jgi:hypothetical protein
MGPLPRIDCLCLCSSHPDKLHFLFKRLLNSRRKLLSVHEGVILKPWNGYTVQIRCQINSHQTERAGVDLKQLRDNFGHVFDGLLARIDDFDLVSWTTVPKIEMYNRIDAEVFSKITDVLVKARRPEWWCGLLL